MISQHTIKLLLPSLLFAGSILPCSSQNFNEQFRTCFQAGDTSCQHKVLQQWEKQNPTDAELFTSYFNYFFLQSKKSLVSLSKDQPAGESLSFVDSTGQTAGFIGEQKVYDDALMQKGFAMIDKGIELYPNRLDMRFGKIYALGQMENWPKFTEGIVEAVRVSSTNKNAWTWTNNEKKEDGKNFFLSSVQGYQVDLYNTGSDALLANMQVIAQEILKYYPDHVESLSNLSVTYLLKGEFDEAIETLKRAERIDPNDGIVLSNIAHAYKSKGNTANAIQYYEKVLKVGDQDQKDYATQQIAALKSKK